jgi:hypothetical protein
MEKKRKTNGISLLHKVKPITAGNWQPFQLLWLLLEATKVCSLKLYPFVAADKFGKKERRVGDSK